MRTYIVESEGGGRLYENFKRWSHGKIVQVNTHSPTTSPLFPGGRYDRGRSGAELVGYLLEQSEGYVKIGVHTYRSRDGAFGNRGFVAQVLRIPSQNITSMTERN